METISVAVLKISSPAFKDQDFIPDEYTCNGEGINPPIAIENIPEGTKSLALIMEDPDAPRGTFDHWLMWDIEPSRIIGKNSSPGTEGKNSSRSNGYTGPCPPSGTHHYHFKLYALDKKLDMESGAGKTMLEEAMKDHVLASGEIVGLYGKSK